MEVFGFENVPDHIHIALQRPALEVRREREHFSARRIRRIVHRVIRNGWGDLAGDNAVQLRGSSQAAELNGLKQQLRGLAERLNIALGPAVRQANPREREPVQRIACKQRKTLAILAVILRQRRVDGHRLPHQDRKLFFLIEVVLRRENRKSGRNRPVQQIRFRESEKNAALDAPKIRRKSERLPESQEIVRLIGQSQESARKPADSSGKTDVLLASFMDLKIYVDRASFRISLQIRILFLDFIEIAELIQPKNAQFPQTVVKQTAFIQQNLAPDHFVARRRIPRKFDPVNKELLLLVEIKRQVHRLGRVIGIKGRIRGEIDKPVIAIELRVVLDGFTNFGNIEDLPFLDGKCILQKFHIEIEILIRVRAANNQPPHAVLHAFLDGNGYVRANGAVLPNQRPRPRKKAIVLCFHRLENWLARRHQHPKISVILIQTLYAHGHVFIQLVAIVGLAEQIDIRKTQRNGNGTRVMHRPDNSHRGKRVIPGDGDVADLHLRPFIDIERQAHRICRRDPLVCRLHRRVHVPVLGKQLLNDHFGALYFRRIEPALHRQVHFAVFERIQNVRLGNRFISFVVDIANGGAFRNVKNHNLAVRHVRTVFHFQPDILEELRVPQRAEIAVHGRHAVRVARPRKDVRHHRLALHAAVAYKLNALDYWLLAVR